MAAKTAIALIILASLIYAIPVLEPFQKDVSNGEDVYLGEIGPGQTIAISIDGIAKSGGMFGTGGVYDNATVGELPQGWSFTGSDWDGIPLQVKITADKNANEGMYKARIDVLDAQPEGLANVSFYVSMNITHDVLDASLDGNSKETMSGQPARFYINITNKANTGDAFVVSSSNVRDWAFKKYVYIPAKSSKTVYYEVAAAEEARYYPVITVVSQSSAMINKTMNASVSINPSLIADYKATNNGMLFFPAMSGIIYALAGLVSNLF